MMGNGTLDQAKATAVSLRGAYFTADVAIRQLRLSPAAAADLNTFLANSASIVGGLDLLQGIGTLSEFQTSIGTEAAKLTTYTASKEALRHDVGLPQRDPWFSAHSVGTTIYADDFTNPKSGWLTAAGVKYANGHLVVTAANGGNEGSSPSTPYNFDGSHVSYQADVKLLAPSTTVTYYGLQCAPQAGNLDVHLQGLLGSDGSWIIGHGEQNGNGTYELTAGKPGAPSIKTGSVSNHLRIDCDQSAAGDATVRFYINGTMVGYGDDPLQLAKDNDGGVIVNSQGGPSVTAEYSNWVVSTIGAAG